MKRLVFAAGIIAVGMIAGCKKEICPEPIKATSSVYQPAVKIKQIAFVMPESFGDSVHTYGVINYKVATISSDPIPITEVKLTLTVHLKNGTNVILYDKDLVNFTHNAGYDSSKHGYPYYWITTLSAEYGLVQPYYSFTEADISSFTYEAEAKLGRGWEKLPTESRDVHEPVDPFWLP